MKKYLALALACTLGFPILAAAEDAAVTYEAEKAILTGNLTLKTDVTCSGWKSVGTFENSTDKLEFTISVPADGLYNLTLTSKGIGGDKLNNVLVDGRQVGQFKSGSMSFGQDTVKGVELSAGEHSVAITVSWGWMYLDCLTVSPAQAIPDDVYHVTSELINPNATDQARKLFSYLK